MPGVELVALFIFSSLFLVFIYKPDYLSILSSKPILFIGLISYPLYLIHQNIGVLLLNVLSDTFKIKYPEILIFPVTLLMLFLAYLLHKYIERPLGNISKRIFQKREV
jgi:peptidoglycan/LPS O-acetylase OafA/YrhL